MSRFFKASLSALAILGCAVVIMLGTLTAYGGYTLLAEPIGIPLLLGGAFVALLGGLSLHLLLRRPPRQEVLEDEGW
jgi:amino acid transporter